MNNEHIPRTMGWKSNAELKKGMRKKPTKSEARLWKHLKNKQFNNLRFRRQHGIGPYIVDFYHAPVRVIIEIDGGIHAEPEVQLYDQEREEYLKALGYSVLRFKNEDVLYHLNQVLLQITNFIHQFSLYKNSSLLLPLQGGAGSKRSGETEGVRGDVTQRSVVTEGSYSG